METVFSLANLTVMPFWLAMIFAPRARWTERLVRSPLIVLPPIALYAALVLPNLAAILPAVARPELPKVSALLGASLGATAAWAHFLAFDLFVGRWIYLDARERGQRAPLTSLVLVATLLLGPLGLAAHLAARGRLGALARAGYQAAAEASRPLARLGLASLGWLAVSLLLMLADPRQLGGASLWLKPAKFAISIGIASFTLAALLRHLHLPEKAGRRAVRVIVVTMALELVLITFQAARGVASHFNFSTFPNAAIFQVMAAAIVLFTIAIGYLAVRSFRQTFEDRALGWGIRLGFVAMLFGSVVAFAMPRPTPDQLAAMKAGQPKAMIGAHTVGAPDGGPGLPVTHWSTEAGDLRVPHFIGIHGLQILPLVGWRLGRLRRRELAARLRAIAGAGYLGLTATTLVQALRARPLLAPDAVTLALGGAVALACTLAATFSIALADRRRALAAPVG